MTKFRGLTPPFPFHPFHHCRGQRHKPLYLPFQHVVESISSIPPLYAACYGSVFPDGRKADGLKPIPPTPLPVSSLT